MRGPIKYFIFSFILLLASCSKNVTLNVPPASTQIVVEGHIEPNSTAYLYLSHNFNFYGTISILSIISNDVIHGAQVTVSDGITTDTMYETNPSLGFYQNKNLKGVPGKVYYLKVVALGQTLTASTTLLPPIKLDSVWFKPQQNLDSLGYLWAQLSDPITPGSNNNYRWFAKRLGKDRDTTFVPPDQSVFNDLTFRGQKFQFFYGRGSVPGSKAADDTNSEAGYFVRHDTVVVKFCTLDNLAYNFYSSYYYQVDNSFNPFGSPAPIKGNVTGALGIWCGYGSYLDTVVCK
jgi:hypothetical protein